MSSPMPHETWHYNCKLIMIRKNQEWLHKPSSHELQPSSVSASISSSEKEVILTSHLDLHSPIQLENHTTSYNICTSRIKVVIKVCKHVLKFETNFDKPQLSSYYNQFHSKYLQAIPNSPNRCFVEVRMRMQSILEPQHLHIRSQCHFSQAIRMKIKLILCHICIVLLNSQEFL